MTSKEMPARVVADEYDTLNVPVIPCRKVINNRSKMLGAPAFEVGWEGVKIVPNEDEGGGFKAKIDKNFTLAILEDGYCEIPKTKRNEAKLDLLTKPIVHKKIKMKVVQQDNGRGGTVDVKIPDLLDGKVQYTDEDDFTEPPSYVRLKSRRQFDPTKDSRVDLVRPWLKKFVSVPDAVMLPHPLED